MSDIFFKTDASGSPGWRKMINLFFKTDASGSPGWKQAIAIWLRTADQWLKVWPVSGVFASRTAWIGPDSTTTYDNRLTQYSYIYIGSNYYGNNAIWDANGFTINNYTYAWRYFTAIPTSDNDLGTIFPGETATPWSGATAAGAGVDILPLSTWDNATNNTTYDRKYLTFEAKANTTNTSYTGVSRSPYIKIIRRVPEVSGTPSMSVTNPQVGTAITFSASWNTTEARKAESNRTTVKWYKNSTSSTTGGILVQDSTSLTPPPNIYSYSPQPTDVGSYIYAVEERFNSGTDETLGLYTGVKATAITAGTVTDINYQLAGNQRRIALPSNFTANTVLYISTNGFINWGGTDPGGSRSMPTSGITLAPLLADLRQGADSGTSNTVSGGGLWTFADSTNYYVRWRGGYWNDSLQMTEYQVKFYWNQAYADVYFINNGLTSVTPSTTAVQDGLNAYRSWSQSTSQSSTLISLASMTRSNLKDGVDDDRTQITASLPSAPTGGSASITNSGGTQISTGIPGSTVLYLTKTDATGSPTPTASWVWERNDGGTGGSTFRTVQTAGNTYTTSSADNNYSVRATVTWSNGTSPNQVVTTNSVGFLQYTVTWDRNTGTSGGGTTTQYNGVSHTAPSVNKNSYLVTYSVGTGSGTAPTASQAVFPMNGYYSTTSGSASYGPIAVGGTFIPDQTRTMYARWGATSNSITLAGQGSMSKTNNDFGGWNIGGTTYAAGTSYTPTANVTATAIWIPNVSKPSGGSVTLSGNGVAGTLLTATTTGWSPTPDGFTVEIRASTTNPVTYANSVNKSTNSLYYVSSTNYTVTTSDANAPVYYFKGFATAYNAGGTSTMVESNQITSSRLQKPTGLTLTYNGWNGSQHSWSASWNSVTGATSYSAYREVAQTNGGTVQHTSTAQTGLTSTSATFTTGTQANTWARFYVKAVNLLDDSGYAGPSSWSGPSAAPPHFPPFFPPHFPPFFPPFFPPHFPPFFPPHFPPFFPPHFPSGGCGDSCNWPYFGEGWSCTCNWYPG